MKAIKILHSVSLILLVLAGCSKDKDPVASNNRIELSENPDPTERISGTYEAIAVKAAFKVGDGFNSYQEGNINLIKPDGSIKGGGYKVIISPVGRESVSVSVEGGSTNFAKIQKNTIGTFSVYTEQNGDNTHYHLRKENTSPIALTFDRYRSEDGFLYLLNLNFWYNQQSGFIHWGRHEEIEPAPQNWFYLNGDEYMLYLTMFRQVNF